MPEGYHKTLEIQKKRSGQLRSAIRSIGTTVERHERRGEIVAIGGVGGLFGLYWLARLSLIRLWGFDLQNSRSQWNRHPLHDNGRERNKEHQVENRVGLLDPGQ